LTRVSARLHTLRERERRNLAWSLGRQAGVTAGAVAGIRLNKNYLRESPAIQ
jgi:hypothetical protein